jgi:hypothetical protein
MTNLTDLDREALERALTVARSESPARSKQLDAMLKDEPWEQVAKFASYAAQTRLLHLQPWETPPIWITNIEAALKMPDDPRHISGAARLLKRLLDAGLSKFEPDPVKALAEAEQRQTAK